MLLIDGFFLLYFFPIFISIYYFIRKHISLANAFIVLCSIYFYSTFGLNQLPIFLVPLVVDYGLGIAIHKTRKRLNKKMLLSIGIILNVGILGYFKYTNFLLSNFSPVFHIFHFTLSSPLILPIGISFITFQRISYIMDVYRKKTRPEKNFLRYATYASLFPQLISGPIVRFAQVKNELKKRKVDCATIFQGTKLFTVGFGYKILIADQLYIFESYLAQRLHTLHFIDSLLLVLYFTFRIYFDFLGYSFMAIGLAGLIGFDFPYNFDAPYISKSITEFWRRWNITLSNWLRDYLYISLGGNRKGKIRTYCNLFITMFLAGLWHGANWNFIAWGMLHGIYLIIERIFMTHKIHVNIHPFLKNIYAFLLVMISWIFFRFTNVSDILLILSALIHVHITGLSQISQNIFFFTLPSFFFAIILSFLYTEKHIVKIKPTLFSVIILLVVFSSSLCLALLKSKIFFIYNQF